MNARTRLKREIMRRRRREAWPMPFTRITAPNGLHIRVTLRLRDYGMRATYRARGSTVHAAWPPTPEVFRELNRWASIRCWWCMDNAVIEIHDRSTDAVISHQCCPGLNDPKRHPPLKPVPLAAGTDLIHHPECDGSGRPSCCPPF